MLQDWEPRKGGKTNVLSYVSCFYLKKFCENEKEALSERVPPDSMAATNGPIKAQINAEVVEYYTFEQCKYLLQSPKFFIKQLMSCQ